jgi:hypothetical protein
MEVGDEGRWLDLEEIEPVFVPTGHDHMTCLHMTRLIRVVASPQLAAPSAGWIPAASAPPLFRGMWAAHSQPTRELRGGET